MPDPQQPTDTQKLGAIEDRVAELMRRTDTLVADAAVARVQARRDAVEEPKSEPKADDGDERLRTLIRDEIRAALKHAVAREPEDGEERKEGEPEAMASDDDRDRADVAPGDPWHEGRPSWAENPNRRGDTRRDSRGDTARQVADENTRLEAQYAFDQVFNAVEGTRAPKPLDGMSARSYSTYCLKRLQKYSDNYKDIDLKALPPDAFALADRQIRADAMHVGSHPQELSRFMSTGALQREIIRTDRTGRRISEFVGPINAANGMFAPFDLPPKRFRGFNRNPNQI
jgi:hypothetical protein